MKNKLVFEPKLNIFLSELLNQMGVISNAEYLNKGRRDIVIYYQNLQIVLEGSYFQQDAEKDARKRIEQLACDVAVAICYPKIFHQNLSSKKIKEQLKTCSRFLVKIIISEDLSETLFQFFLKKKITAKPVTDWQECNLNSLASLIREVGQFLITEEHMKEIEQEVDNFIREFVNCLCQHNQSNIIAKNLYNILYNLYGFSIGDPLKIKEAIFAQSGLAILLSSIYYETIRYAHNLQPLRWLKDSKGPQLALEVATEDILKINYEPIFDTTKLVLPLLPPMAQLFAKLIDLASKIASKRSLLRKDIAGRIYHKIVGDWSIKKGLATFYTQIPAAYLLLYLAEPVLSKICDFACGSGTLLTAAYSATNHHYRFSLLKKGIEKEPKEIEREFHTNFISSCYGFDVLNYATQITALNLAFHSPELPVNDFHLYPIPLGYKEDFDLVSLGSLEIVKEFNTSSLTLGMIQKSITKTGVREKTKVSLKEILSHLNSPNLIAMNPPFTRATGRGGKKGGGLFGFIPDKNIRGAIFKDYKNLRKKVLEDLKEIGKRILIDTDLQNLLNEREFQPYANIGQAGEGLLFLYLAHVKVREGGKICFVLPKSLLNGVSWFLARCLLIANYHIEYIVISYDAQDGYNFSESTSLSECLLIARKTKKHTENEKTNFIILLSKPKTSMEAIGLSKAIKEGAREEKKYVEAGTAKAFILKNSGKEMFDYLDNWGRFVFLPNLMLLKEIKNLLNGRINIGSVGKRIPLTRLNNLILSIGIDAHEFIDNFQIINKNIPGSLKALHGGGEEHRRKMKITPNAYALPTGRRGEELFKQKAGKLLVPDRIRVTTAHVISMISEEPVLSNVFYAIKLKNEDEDRLKALCLYLNTTWGILTILANREETEGAWVRLKMSHWRLLPVLDVDKMSSSKIRELAKIFDKFKNKSLQRIPLQYGVEGAIDKLRKEIDLAFLYAMDISIEEKKLLWLYKEISSSLRQWIGG